MKVSSETSLAPFVTDGKINDALFHTKEWRKFYIDNVDIFQKIADVFMENKHPYNKCVCLDTVFIAEQLDRDIKFIHQTLAVWNRHYCTFYKKYGRLTFNDNKTLWIYSCKN